MIKATNTSPGGIALRKDWTQGSIIQNLLLLSWPMIVLGLLYSGNIILEMIWLGRLGAASMAGVGVAGIVVVTVITVKSGFSVGERAIIARNVGAGDIASANHIAGQGFLIATVYGLLIGVLGMFFYQSIFNLFGLEARAAAEGGKYLHIVLTGWITEAFWITSFSAMQASGDTVTPMKIAIIIRLVNAAICPFLILGWWIFPRMGVSGAATAYIIVTTLGMILCLWTLFTGRTRLHLTWKDFKPDYEIIWRIMKIGVPACFMGLGKNFGDLILTWLMIPFGTLALAAHNLIYRIESFINTPGTGLGSGSGVLVGQNLGAGQPARARRSGWQATGLAAAFMLICSLVLLIWPQKIIGLFNVEPDLVRTGAVFIRIAVTGYLFMSVFNVMQNCIPGSGDTLAPMLIILVTIWIVQLPLAWVLSRYTGLGMYGIRWAIAIGFAAGAAAFLIYYRLGRWQTKKV